MNAKMVITVPIENIPEEVSKILERLVDSLSTIKEKLNNCVYNQNESLVIDEIDSIRKSLSLLDLNLEDCHSILVGYTKYKNDQRMKELNNKNKESANNESTNDE